MITLAPGSYCDVCAEEYGPQCLPHSIPCGHVLCASCCSTIVEKAQPLPGALAPKSGHASLPGCPFCREAFQMDSVRVIRTDFTTSGWSTPRRVPPASSFSPFASILDENASEVFTRKLSSSLNASRDGNDTVKALEDRVARVAQKKSSVEEVSTLHKELEGWLTGAVRSGDHTTSLYLSAALLRAILTNHVSHSEASKNAKATEAALRARLEETDAEMRRQYQAVAQRRDENEQLRKEVAQLKALATIFPTSSASSNSAPNTPGRERERDYSRDYSRSPTPTRDRERDRPMSPPTPTPYSAASRFTASHGRSVSVSASASASSASRPSTPHHSSSTSHASHQSNSTSTGAPPAIPSYLGRSSRERDAPPRSHTSAGMRVPFSTATTSASSMAARAQTPGPSSSSSRSKTPGPGSGQGYYPSSTSTSGPGIPPKPRRLSMSQGHPQLTHPSLPMGRSLSDDREKHERWIPPSPAPGMPPARMTRTVSTSASQAARRGLVVD